MIENTDFTLPKNWHVVVTEDNKLMLGNWLGYNNIKVGQYVGMTYFITLGSCQKGYGDLAIANSIVGGFEIGEQITDSQFKTHVLGKLYETKLISSFCREQIRVGDFLYGIGSDIPLEECKFNSNIEWLMPIYENLKQLTDIIIPDSIVGYVINSDSVFISFNGNTVSVKFGNSTVTRMYNCLIEFIEFLNSKH